MGDQLEAQLKIAQILAFLRENKSKYYPGESNKAPVPPRTLTKISNTWLDDEIDYSNNQQQQQQKESLSEEKRNEIINQLANDILACWQAKKARNQKSRLEKNTRQRNKVVEEIKSSENSYFGQLTLGEV
jgi:hypothetical protein